MSETDKIICVVEPWHLLSFGLSCQSGAGLEGFVRINLHFGVWSGCMSDF